MSLNRTIAFVANSSWGMYKYRLYLIKKLLEKGFSIYVLAPRDSYSDKFEHLAGLTYIELHHLKGRSISPLKDALLYRELLKHYRSLRPALIFHYTIKANIFGTLAAARVRIPSISVITGLGYTFTGKGLLKAAVKLLYKQVLRKNTEVWLLNKDDRLVLASEKLVDPAKTFLLPGEGVDTDAFFASPYKAGKKEVTFLFIGRMIRHKGVYEFVQAAKLLQQRGLAVRCQLLGFFDDNPAAIPRQQVEEWNRQKIVDYLGHTDQVASFIEQADCIVLPSYYGEGMPLSLLEGASMCKALIAARMSGCRDLIEEGVNGYLCHQKDGADLAEKMETYYRLPEAEKRQMGIEGRNKVLRYFTRDIIAGIYLDKINKFQSTGNQH